METEYIEPKNSQLIPKRAIITLDANNVFVDTGYGKDYLEFVFSNFYDVVGRTTISERLYKSKIKFIKKKTHKNYRNQNTTIFHRFMSDQLSIKSKITSKGRLLNLELREEGLNPDDHIFVLMNNLIEKILYISEKTQIL